MIGIIDIGMGNLKSVYNALEYIDAQAEIFDDPYKIREFDKVILPGVGAFAEAIKRLNESGFYNAIVDFAKVEKKPILGICLGMQLLYDFSLEHGENEGLKLIPGGVKPLSDKINDLPLPHVGWNTLLIDADSSIVSLKKDGSSPVVYFVHSFYCDTEDKSLVTSKTSYGFDFDVSVQKDNIFGAQFHPEKSQKDGLEILTAFNKL